jgi:hypothetical protein
MATAFLNRVVLSKDVMIDAERVNLVYMTLADSDIKENKKYSVKCVCGRLFNVTLYMGEQEYLEERNSMCKFVTKQKNACYHMSGTIYRDVGIHIDKDVPYVNVSWNCIWCKDKITIFITRFFKRAGMSWSVLSKGCLYNAEYLFEKLLHHDDEDTFAFVLVHNRLRYRIYIYGDWSYTVVLATTGGVYNETIDVIDTFVGDFLVFCQNVNTERIYCEQEIKHYLLVTFGLHITDWSIWYAFFSRPYIKSELFTENRYHRIKVAHCINSKKT